MKKSLKKDFTQTLKILLAAVVLSLGITYVYAWTTPTVAPPGGNTPAPLDVGTTTQSKLGQLVINTNTNSPYAQGLVVSGDIITDGTIKVADTLTPTGKAGDSCSGYAGIIKFTDGNLLACAGNNKWQGLTNVTNTVTTTTTPPPTTASRVSVNLVIATDTSDYVIAEQAAVLSAISANPSAPLDVSLTINAGVTASGAVNTVTGGGLPAIRNNSSTTLPAGSEVVIINNGRILGFGGQGGSGGMVDGDDQIIKNGSNGYNGGDAIDITGTKTTLDNYGSIWAGGGGGGGGGSKWCDTFMTLTTGGGYAARCMTGGGGGGGVGANVLLSGTGGASGWERPYCVNTDVGSGKRGENFTPVGNYPGNGGAGAYISWDPTTTIYWAGKGGSGGGWASDGTAGVNVDGNNTFCPNGGGLYSKGGKGGVAGYAIRTNGTSLTRGAIGNVVGKVI